MPPNAAFSLIISYPDPDTAPETPPELTGLPKAHGTVHMGVRARYTPGKDICEHVYAGEGLALQRIPEP